MTFKRPFWSRRYQHKTNQCYSKMRLFPELLKTTGTDVQFSQKKKESSRTSEVNYSTCSECIFSFLLSRLKLKVALNEVSCHLGTRDSDKRFAHLYLSFKTRERFCAIRHQRCHYVVLSTPAPPTPSAVSSFIAFRINTPRSVASVSLWVCVIPVRNTSLS